MRATGRTVRGAVVGLAVLGMAACGGTVDAGSGNGSGGGEEDGLVRDVEPDAPPAEPRTFDDYVRERSVALQRFAYLVTRHHEDARDVGLMQAEIYLSDLGIVEAAAAPYLEGARKAIAGVMQGRVQN